MQRHVGPLAVGHLVTMCSTMWATSSSTPEMIPDLRVLSHGNPTKESPGTGEIPPWCWGTPFGSQIGSRIQENGISGGIMVIPPPVLGYGADPRVAAAVGLRVAGQLPGLVGGNLVQRLQADGQRHMTFTEPAHPVDGDGLGVFAPKVARLDHQIGDAL